MTSLIMSVGPPICSGDSRKSDDRQAARSSRAYPKLATIEASASELQSASPQERSSSGDPNALRQGEAMSVHSKEEVLSNIDDEVFGTSFLPHPLPKYKFPKQETYPTAAYQLVHDQLLLDGNSRQNLATFCQTWVEPESSCRCTRLRAILDSSLSGYLKLGFGGAHTESNQRLMYTSAWASPQ